MTDDLQQLQLELGGSFFELIEFTLTRKVGGRQLRGIYGVNVAKVREVVRMPKINPLAARVPGVAGVFELRGVPIPAVHLAVVLGDDFTEPTPQQQLIVTEFSQKRAGFVVDTTRRIRRVAWDKVLPPSADAGSYMNGMTLIENNEFLFILDLERILMTLEEQAAPRPAAQLHSSVAQYAPRAAPRAVAVAPTPQPAPSETLGKILVVEDSSFIRGNVKLVLQRVGFTVVEAGDGVEALEQMEKFKGIDLIVCDIEMPRMDGITFTKKLRAHPALSQTPLVLHTSLSGKVSQQAGLLAGANGYVIKNDFRALLELIKEILGLDLDHALSA